MQYSRTRDHLLSHKAHRSEITKHLGIDEDSELIWFGQTIYCSAMELDDDCEDELDYLLSKEKEDQEEEDGPSKEEQEDYDEYRERMEDETEEWRYYDDPYEDYYDRQDCIDAEFEPPKDNLTREGAEWSF